MHILNCIISYICCLPNNSIGPVAWIHLVTMYVCREPIFFRSRLQFVQLTAENKSQMKRKWMKSYCRPGTTTIIITIITIIIITMITIIAVISIPWCRLWWRFDSSSSSSLEWSVCLNSCSDALFFEPPARPPHHPVAAPPPSFREGNHTNVCMNEWMQMRMKLCMYVCMSLITHNIIARIVDDDVCMYDPVN